MPTTAEADGGAAAEVEGFALSVVNRELTLYTQRAVVSYVYFCFGQVILLAKYKIPIYSKISENLKISGIEEPCRVVRTEAKKEVTVVTYVTAAFALGMTACAVWHAVATVA